MRLKKSSIFHVEFTRIKWKTLFISFFILSFLFSCASKEKPEKINAFADRTKIPRLHANDITTVISDSGITRYRISAPTWDVYDRATQPYWEFPKGIHLERFDMALKVDANIHSKYAKFNENEQTWELRGKVKAINLQGELFETEQLFWNQRQERFYSDSLVKITQATRIITGIGFESNQNMTKYSIKRPEGVFPVTENESNSSSIPANNLAPGKPVK
jgi:LPS export ABC transporter protein LptC